MYIYIYIHIHLYITFIMYTCMAACDGEELAVTCRAGEGRSCCLVIILAQIRSAQVRAHDDRA